MVARTIREILTEEVIVGTNAPPPVDYEHGWYVRFAGLDIRKNLSKSVATAIGNQLRGRIEAIMREAVERHETSASA